MATITVTICENFCVFVEEGLPFDIERCHHCILQLECPAVVEVSSAPKAQGGFGGETRGSVCPPNCGGSA